MLLLFDGLLKIPNCCAGCVCVSKVSTAYRCSQESTNWNLLCWMLSVIHCFDPHFIDHIWIQVRTTSTVFHAENGPILKTQIDIDSQVKFAFGCREKAHKQFLCHVRKPWSKIPDFNLTPLHQLKHVALKENCFLSLAGPPRLAFRWSAVFKSHLEFFFLFFPRKQRQNKSRLVLAGLATSLLLTYIFFMIGMEGTPGTPLCTFSAVTVHYTLLSAFCWMLVEAIVIYLGLHKDMFVVARDVRVLPAAIFSWGK